MAYGAKIPYRVSVPRVGTVTGTRWSMKRLTLPVVALLLMATPLVAQKRKTVPEIRPFAGVSIPTGSQRDLFKMGPLLGLQAAAEVKPFLHAVGTVGWVPVTSKYSVGDHNVNFLDYNAGFELGPVATLAKDRQFMPFFGVGAGARTYLFAEPGLSDKTCLAGYATVGAEFKIGISALRVEARDQLYCYKSPFAGVESKTRNDLGLALGLAYHLK
jgi:hypothetical protein